jgi:hypothetical protein
MLQWRASQTVGELAVSAAFPKSWNETGRAARSLTTHLKE